MKIIYEELCFPEVEDLSRDWEVIIPMGTGPLPNDLPGENQIVMPAIPFGFSGPLQVESFRPLLSSLLEILAEDGFHRVHTVDCPGPVPKLTGEVALLATGHTEQHGFHLPLATDTIIVEGLASALEQTCPQISRLPSWPYGVSSHRRQFPGTLTIEPRAWEDFWVDIVGALRRQGFRQFYILNGHGGNHSFLVNVAKFTGERWPDIFLASSFLHTSSGSAADLLQAERLSPLMGHACELETNYLLHLRPELVHMERAVDEIDFVSTDHYRMDWISDGALVANPCWTDDTKTGSYGAPSVSTAAQGKRWMEEAVVELARHIHEVQEQYQTRLRRRAEGWVEGAWRPLWEERRNRPSPTPPEQG
jgi:creatinine amidohydrolase